MILPVAAIRRLGRQRGGVRARACVLRTRTRRRSWKAAHVPRGRAGTYLPTREAILES